MENTTAMILGFPPATFAALILATGILVVGYALIVQTWPSDKDKR